MGDEDRCAILLPDRSEDDGNDVRQFGVGSVLIWARNETRPIVVVVPEDRAGELARQAQDFETISVWMLDGTTVTEAAVSPLASIPALSEAALGRAELFESVGASAVDDFGRLVAEVEGLEIARADDDGQIQVGVGTADRELHGYVHTHVDPAESLEKAATMVRSVRAMGAASHPLNRRARQRWLRSVAFQQPSLLGAEVLTLLAPLGERILQLGPEPAAALDPSTNVLYVFSAGIDPDVVPIATDYRRRHQPDRTVIVTSHRDRFPATESIAAMVGIETLTMDAPY